MKRLWRIVLVAGLLLLLTAVGVHIWWLHSAPQDERRSFVWPGGGSGSSSRPITVDLAPDLAAAGVSVVGGGSGEEVEGQVFLRIDKPHLLIALATSKASLDDTS